MANSQHAEDNPKHVNMSGEVPATSAAVQPDTVAAGPTPVPCAVPSFAAASELLSAPYSCLVMNTHRRHIALPPQYLKRKRTGIQEELENELLRFSQSLGGVPLAYDNIQIVGHKGDIYDDSGYIHLNVEANFIVFQPQQGEKLLGKVNKLGVSHVGCLVHGCFNASIPKPHLVTMETWRDAGPRIGSELEFEVTALDADTAGVLLIRGKLDKTRVQELLAIAASTESSVTTEQLDQPDTAPAPEPTQESPDDTPKKKKKKKKDKVKEEEREEAITAPPSHQQDTTAELNGKVGEEENGSGTTEKKKKKKKKDKQLKEEEEEVELSRMEVHGSDSSGYVSDKQSKKRKHEPDITSSFSEEPPKSKKKKRKSEVEQFT